jgi:hypothetical protein
MSVTITFTGETPEAIENQLDEWTKVLREGRRTVEAADKLNARVAEVQANVARAAKEEAQRVEAHASNVKALKEMAAKAAAFAAEPVEKPVTRPLDVANVGGDEAPTDILTTTDPAGPAECLADAPDYAIVREAVLRLAVVKTPEITRALLDTYGVRKAADLDPSRWAALLADVNAAMA